MSISNPDKCFLSFHIFLVNLKILDICFKLAEIMFFKLKINSIAQSTLTVIF